MVQIVTEHAEESDFVEFILVMAAITSDENADDWIESGGIVCVCKCVYVRVWDDSNG